MSATHLQVATLLVLLAICGVDCSPSGLLTIIVLSHHVEAKTAYRKEVLKYPQDTQFWATDFFVRGCKNFLERCPKAYKVQPICARSYDGNFKNFNNYCEMQYENCNTWKNWVVFKRERC